MASRCAIPPPEHSPHPHIRLHSAASPQDYHGSRRPLPCRGKQAWIHVYGCGCSATSGKHMPPPCRGAENPSPRPCHLPKPHARRPAVRPPTPDSSPVRVRALRLPCRHCSWGEKPRNRASPVRPSLYQRPKALGPSPPSPTPWTRLCMQVRWHLSHGHAGAAQGASCRTPAVRMPKAPFPLRD